MNKSHIYVDQNHHHLYDDAVLMMNLIDVVEMANVDYYYLYERQVILNLLLNYDSVIVILVNEATGALDYDLKNKIKFY